MILLSVLSAAISASPTTLHFSLLPIKDSGAREKEELALTRDILLKLFDGVSRTNVHYVRYDDASEQDKEKKIAIAIHVKVGTIGKKRVFNATLFGVKQRKIIKRYSFVTEEREEYVELVRSAGVDMLNQISEYRDF